MDEGMGVTGGVLGGMFRPVLDDGLEGVIAVVQVELGPRDSRPADDQLDRALVELARPPLAAVGPELLDQNAQRPASAATLAARPEEHGAEAAPAVAHAVHVLAGAQLADDLVFEAPELIGQIAALAR